MANLKATSLKKKTAPKPKSKIKKPVAKKPAVKTTAKPAAKTVAKKTTTKKIAVKKSAAQKPVPKKIIAKKTITKKTPAKKTVSQKSTPSGLPEQMRDAVLKVLDEKQAEEIVCINLMGRSSMADYLIIASGRAGRQVAAIADHLRQAFFKLGVRKIRIEGQSEANWVLVDAGDVVIHLFRPEVRRYYDLDAIWNGKQIQK